MPDAGGFRRGGDVGDTLRTRHRRGRRRPAAAAPPGWRTKVSSTSISVFFGKFCVIGR